MWEVYKFDEVIHVFPQDDERLHMFSPLCKCEPRVETEEEFTIYVHDAFDGRIAVERANEILNGES